MSAAVSRRIFATLTGSSTVPGALAADASSILCPNGRGDLAGHFSDFGEQVGLEWRGCLHDDWDQEFGRSMLHSREQGLAELNLWRYAGDDWNKQAYV